MIRNLCSVFFIGGLITEVQSQASDKCQIDEGLGYQLSSKAFTSDQRSDQSLINLGDLTEDAYISKIYYADSSVNSNIFFSTATPIFRFIQIELTVGQNGYTIKGEEHGWKSSQQPNQVKTFSRNDRIAQMIVSYNFNLQLANDQSRGESVTKIEFKNDFGQSLLVIGNSQLGDQEQVYRIDTPYDLVGLKSRSSQVGYEINSMLNAGTKQYVRSNIVFYFGIFRCKLREEPYPTYNLVAQISNSGDCSSGNQQLMISWQPNPQGGQNIQKYDVQLGTNINGPFKSIMSCQTLQYSCNTLSLTDVKNQFGYDWGSYLYVRVIAINNVGSSQPGIAVSAGQMISQPNQVQNLERDQSIPRSKDAIYLEWDALTNDQRGGYAEDQLYYELQIKLSSQPDWKVIKSDIQLSSQPKFTVTNSNNPVALVVGYEYDFQVFARTKFGNCYSIASFKEQLSHVLQPDPPTCIKTYNKHPFIVVQFTPAENNESQIQYYTFEVKTKQGLWKKLDSSFCDGKKDKYVDPVKQIGSNFYLPVECSFDKSKLMDSNFGLTWGDKVEVQIMATNNIGDSLKANSGSPSPNGCGSDAFILNPPNIPINLNSDTVADTRKSITFTWQKPEASIQRPEVIYCSVYRYSESVRLQPNSNDPLLTSYTTTFQLTQGQEYGFEVTCSNKIGESERAQIQIRASGPPMPPTDIISTSQSASSICLSWNAPIDNGGEIVTSYFPNDNTRDPRNLNLVPSVPVSQTRKCFDNLQKGQNYCFKIASVNKKGISGLSEQKCFFTAEKPGPPQNPKLVFNLQAASFTLTYEYPASDGGMPISSYKYYSQTQFMAQRQEIKCSAIIPTALTCQLPLSFAQIVPFKYDWGSTVCLTATALNNLGESSNSAQACTVLAKEPDPPIQVSDDQNRRNIQQIVLTWQDPINDGGSPITSYNIYMTEGNGLNNPSLQYTLAKSSLVSPTRELVVNGLTKGRTYSFKVQANNQVGTSLDSIPYVLFYDPPDYPECPTDIQEIRAETTGSQITFTFMPPLVNGGSPILSYNIKYYPAQNPQNFLVDTIQASNSAPIKHTVRNNIVVGNQYVILISSVNAVGPCIPGAQASILAAERPAAPINPQTKFAYPNYQLSWQRPKDGGSPITSYVIYIYDKFGNRFTPSRQTDCQQPQQILSTSCTVDAKSMLISPYGLTRQDYYTFKVKAINAYGESDFSFASNQQEIMTPPDAPTQLQAYPRETTNTVISMSWEDGFSNGGQQITSYRIQSSLSEKMFDFETETFTLTKKAKVPVKQQNQRYYLTVRATNIMGDSPPSSVLSAVAEIWAELPGPPIIRNDKLVTDNKQIGVIWEKPLYDGNTPLLSYRLQIKAPGSNFFSDVQPTYSVNTFKETITYGIQEGLTYQLQVAALNKVGQGPFSQVIEITAAKGPDAPTNVRFTYNLQQNKIPVTWDRPNMNGAILESYRVEAASLAQQFITWECSFTSVIQSNCEIDLDYAKQRINFGDTLRVRVIAQSSLGESLPSLPYEKLFAFAPSEPINLKEDPTQTSYSQIAFTWSPPLNDNGSKVIDYRVYWRYGDIKVTCENQESVSQNNQLNQGRQIAQEGVTDLRLAISQITKFEQIKEGYSYWISVQARNGIDYGLVSQEIQIRAASVAPPPLNVQLNLNYEDSCFYEVTFRLDPTLRKSQLTGYSVYVSSYSGTGRRLADTKVVNSVTYHKVDCYFNDLYDTNCLIPRDQYLQYVRYGERAKLLMVTHSIFGDSVTSDTSIFYTNMKEPDLPFNLRNDPSVTSKDKIGLLWNEPADNGSKIKYYRVYMKNKRDTFYTLYKTDVVGLKITIENLAYPFVQGEAYQFYVQAANDAGWSEQSDPHTIKVHSSSDVQAARIEDPDATRRRRTMIWVITIFCLLLVANLIVIALYCYWRKNQYYVPKSPRVRHVTPPKPQPAPKMIIHEVQPLPQPPPRQPLEEIITKEKFIYVDNETKFTNSPIKRKKETAFGANNFIKSTEYVNLPKQKKGFTEDTYESTRGIRQNEFERPNNSNMQYANSRPNTANVFQDHSKTGFNNESFGRSQDFDFDRVD